MSSLRRFDFTKLEEARTRTVFDADLATDAVAIGFLIPQIEEDRVVFGVVVFYFACLAPYVCAPCTQQKARRAVRLPR